MICVKIFHNLLNQLQYMIMRNFIKQSIHVSMLLILVACGGGGGDSVNVAPVAKNDNYSVAEGATLAVSESNGVLVNDSDSDTPPSGLQAVIVSGVQNGTLKLQKNGAFTYVYNGVNGRKEDSFEYKVFDGQLESSTAKVMINIKATNTPPSPPPLQAVDDAYSVSEDAVLEENVIKNDEGEGLKITAFDPVSELGVPINLNVSGDLTYDPTAVANIQATPEGIDVVDTFSYTLSNKEGVATVVAQVRVTVTGNNDAPVINEDSYNLDEGATLIVNSGNGVLANDFDAENETLTIAVVNEPTVGTLLINQDGSFDYTHDGSETTSDVFSYTISDGSVETAPVNVQLSINPINDLPQTSSTCSAVAQSAILTGFLDGYDEESPNMLTFSLGEDGGSGVGPLTTSKGTVTIIDQTTGEFKYEPFATGARGNDTFKYQVADIDGGTANGEERVIINSKLMFLGDSITRGVSNFARETVTVAQSKEWVGFRRKLYNDVVADGYGIDLVGSLKHGENAIPEAVDPDHEGHGGWKVSDIAWGQGGAGEGVRAWLNQNPADVVLLHIGTNDLIASTSAPESYRDVEHILDEIDAWEKSSSGNPVTVIVSTIVDTATPMPEITMFNNDLVALLQSRINNSESPNVIIVDQRNALSYPIDMSNTARDYFHPVTSGYNKMADVWRYPLIGSGTQTGTGINDQTGAYSGGGILTKCP